MNEYCVVKFDDGVLSCLKVSKLKTYQGQYSAPWKNTWYHVDIVMMADKEQCENFLRGQNENQMDKSSDMPTADVSEPYGSDYSDLDPDFDPKEYSETDEDSSSKNDKNVESLENFGSQNEFTQHDISQPNDCHHNIDPEGYPHTDQGIVSIKRKNVESCILQNETQPNDSFPEYSEKPKSVQDISELKDCRLNNIDLPEYSLADQGINSKKRFKYMECSNLQNERISNYTSLEDDGNIPTYEFIGSSPLSIVMNKMNSYIAPTNETELNPVIPRSNQGPKKYFCIFCKNLYTKLPLHFENKHRDEEEVRKIVSLPKGCEERRKLIDILRKKGCFEFNTNNLLNTGHLIVARRTKLNKESSDYKVCPYCQGMFSKNSIRKHYSKCIPMYQKGCRSISTLGKRVHARLHKTASPILRDKIFPVMREDDITNIIRYDELVVAFGNNLCLKYRLEHLQKMIRSKLRLIGRFLSQIKDIDKTIDNFTSVFDPEKTDFVFQAINKVASFNLNTQEYDSPAAAADLGTTLKKCAKLLVTICIKTKNNKKKQLVEDFLKVFQEELPIVVGKTVSECQEKQRRRKVFELPSTEEVNLLYNFAAKRMNESFSQLQENFTLSLWKELASSTLISIQIFNRRRSGEVERILIEDFKAYQKFDNEKHSVSFNFNTETFSGDPSKYIRFVIRGKKARGVPVLLSKEMFESILLILELRTQAGVPDRNPYVFGISGNSLANTHFNACKIMREYSEKCMSLNPSLLRGTYLRKHLATQSAYLDLNDNEVGDLANFMGHSEKVHRDHYRLPIAAREIGRVSHLLEMGLGQEKGSVCDERNTNKSGIDDPNGHIPIIDECASDIPENIVPSRDSWEENSFETLYGRQRCVSPMGTIKRKSWNQNEIQIITNLFSKHLRNKTLPSTAECQAAIKGHSSLNGRTAVQLKSWVSNQFKRKTNGSREITTRAYWTEEEKQIMNKVFQRHLSDGILPGLRMCEEILQSHPELRQRTAVTLRAWINNTIKKQNKSKNK